MTITSEIGPLETVIVHRPGPEIARLTPDNVEALLFDDILWLERAQDEHDRFREILRSQGVEVLLFRDLLVETLTDDEVRGGVIDQVVTPAVVGERVSSHLRSVLREAPLEDVTDLLTGGVLASELADWGVDPVFARMGADSYRAVIRALPNLLFMRDNAAWIGGRPALGVLAYPARRRESIYMEAIYKHHVRFGVEEFWFGDHPEDVFPARLEGGDVLVLSPDTVLVGSGERTSHSAIEALARRLFAAGVVTKVIVAHMPPVRAYMHLDTVFTMVDVGKVNVFPGILERTDVFLLEPGPNSTVAVAEEPGLIRAVERALERRIDVVTTGGDAVGRIREQWDDGNNTLAVAPGVVVAYARNTETNRRLRDAGVTVLELDASELCRGRGGSRCMTQPVSRAPVDY